MRPLDELPSRRPSRRALLRGAAAAGAALPLSACGPVRIGQPASYTPPPPGIDDLYRQDLLALLDQALALGALAAPDSVLAADDLLLRIRDALSAQRDALLTGAEAEEIESAAPSPSSATAGAPIGGAASPAPADLPAGAGAQELSDLLIRIRDLAAQAARQVSGSLARPVLAIAAHETWAAGRLASLGVAAAPAPAPEAGQIVPVRDVPASDPPSIGASVDYDQALEAAQEDEWYAGYMHEVLAASASGAQRQALLEEAAGNRERAQQLGQFALADGAPEVRRAAVYPVPGGELSAQTLAALPVQLATALLQDHAALAGAAPFERRPLPIAAALSQAERLAPLVTALPPLPSLETGTE